MYENDHKGVGGMGHFPLEITKLQPNSTKFMIKKELARETPAFGGISLALRRNGAFGGGKKKIGAPAAPHSFKYFCRFMRIPNGCLVLKLDNGKVVSIANEQTESYSHPVPYYNRYCL